MNSLRLKKAIAGISSGLILLGSVVSGPMAAFASHLFADVPTSHWGHDFVSDAVAKGFFDGPSASNNFSFYPDRNLNRAELAKLVVKMAQSAGVLGSTLDTSNAPGFTDVPSGTWYWVYVAASAKANLLSGYKDAAGNTTGKYGPSDLVTRAQAAKAFVNASGAPNKTSPSSTSFFTDVIAGEWYVDYVSTAYNWSILDGYKTAAGVPTGRFGPNDVITRVQTGKIMSNALNRQDRWSGNGNTNGVINGNTNGTNGNANISVPKAGTLDVALSSNTPPATIIPQNTTAARFLTLKLTAGATNDIVINSITITRSGLGDRSDFSKIWGEVAGTRVTSRQSIGTDERATLIFTPAWVVKAGMSADLDIIAQMSGTSGGGSYNALTLKAAGDVESSAQTVTGTFPINGNTMQTANYNVTEVAFYTLGSATNYRVGETNRELGQFKLENKSDSKDVVFQEITFENDGTAPFSDFANLALFVGSTAVAPSASVTINGDFITFRLNPGRTIKYGQTETYSVRGDIVGVDNNNGDTVQLGVKYIEDFFAYEVSTGFGVAQDPNNKWTAPAIAPIIYNISGGTFVLSKASSSPATQTIPPLTTDATFLVGDAKVGQAFQADGVQVIVYFDDGDAGTTTSAAEKAQLAAALDNVRVMWGATTIGSTSLADADLTNISYTNGLLNPYFFVIDSTVTFNTTGQLIIRANVTNNAVEGNRFRFELRAGTGNDQMFESQSPEYLANGNDVPAIELVGTASGNVATVGRASLQVTRVDGLAANKEVVEGVKNYQVLKVRLQAGDTSDVRVNQMRFTNNGNANNSLFPTARLYDAANPATPIQEVNFSGGTADFNSINLLIKANESRDYLLKIDTIEGINGFELIIDMGYIDAKDPNSNDAKINGVLTTDPDVTSTNFVFIGSGILTIQQDSNRPLENVLVANTLDVPVGAFTFQATKDDIEVTDFFLFNSLNGNVNALSSLNGRVNKFTMTWPGMTGSPVVGQLSTGCGESESVLRFPFASRQLLVMRDATPVVATVRADLNGIEDATQTGTQIHLWAGVPAGSNCVSDSPNYRAGTDNGVRALSDATGRELTGSSLAVSGSSNLFVIRNTRPTFARSTPGNATNTLPGTATETEIYRFTVSANGNDSVDLGQLAFQISASAGVSVDDLKVYELNGSQVLGSMVGSAIGTTSVEMTQGAPTSGTRVSAGTTKTYVVKALVADTAIAGTSSVSTKLVSDDDGTVITDFFTNVSDLYSGSNGLVWSDESDPQHSKDGTATADFTNGYLINELNNIDSTTYSQTH